MFASEAWRVISMVLAVSGVTAWGITALAVTFGWSERLSDWTHRCCCLLVSMSFAIDILIVESLRAKLAILVMLILWLALGFTGGLKPKE